MKTITIDVETPNDSIFSKLILKQWDEKFGCIINKDEVKMKDIAYSYVTMMNGLVFMEVKPYWLKNKLKAIYKILF